jgi:hypothetical protein
MNQEAAAGVGTTSIGAPGTAATQTNASNTNASNEVELEFWRSVRSGDKPEEYSAYLTRFPNGNFNGIARARIAALQAGSAAKGADEAQSIATAVPTPETEEQLGLDQRKRSDIQRRLSALGYFGGATDGNFADNTRRAIELWQTKRRYPKSGYFNKLQHDALLAERLPAIRSVDRPPPAQRPQPQAAQAAPAPASAAPPAPAANPAGAAFMGGVLGGAIGSALRH